MYVSIQKHLLIFIIISTKIINKQKTIVDLIINNNFKLLLTTSYAIKVCITKDFCLLIVMTIFSL